MRFKATASLLLGLILQAGVVPAPASDETGGGRYTFSWPFTGDDTMRPRGGTTRGPEVNLVEETTRDFQRIHAAGLSGFERDRRAILAMAGPYRVSFDFLEVVGYAPGYEPARPYQSWGTEYVYVIADEGDSISLQHLLVTTIVGEDGEKRGPFVTKHWRQDWRYEADAVHAYRGQSTWARQSVPAGERTGHWVQTVWQVDDSPRYASWGEWRHAPERSTWAGSRTWRPLPRREFSVRDDYDALVGINRHTILPTGWVHEQRNIKAVVSEPGEIERRVAKEYGLARYERIQGYDFSAGDEYLAATEPFWQQVRDHWDRLMKENEVLHLKSEVDDTKLFEPLFERAQAIADGEREFDAETDGHFVEQTINRYLAGDAGAAPEY